MKDRNYCMGMAFPVKTNFTVWRGVPVPFETKWVGNSSFANKFKNLPSRQP